MNKYFRGILWANILSAESFFLFHTLHHQSAESFAQLPPAYIETAEFDCLHDDGILYAQKLCGAGISAEVNHTKGTMHGFDIVQKAPTTQKALEARVEFMKKWFAKSGEQ